MPRRAATPDTYFQVPLCLLAWGSTVVQRLNMIIEYGCRVAGRSQLAAYADDELGSRLLEKFPGRRLPNGYDDSQRCHAELLMGASQIGVTFGGMSWCDRRIAEFEDFRTEFESKYGRDCLVRLRRDLVFEARDGRGMNYQELAVFAAILSVLGIRRTPVRITLATIRHRAMGYRSRHIASREKGKRMDRARPFTEWQVRRAIQSLQLRQFFNRATYGRRVTYYGIGQDPEAFRKSITDRLTYRTAALDLRRQIDEGMTDKIRRLKALRQTGAKTPETLEPQAMSRETPGNSPHGS